MITGPLIFVGMLAFWWWVLMSIVNRGWASPRVFLCVPVVLALWCSVGWWRGKSTQDYADWWMGRV